MAGVLRSLLVAACLLAGSAGPAFAAAGSGPSEAVFVLQILLLVVAGRLLGEVMQRIGQPAVMGQLIGGLLLASTGIAGVFTLSVVLYAIAVLAACGFLDGRRATTHWRSLDRMREAFPNVTVVPDQHVVDDGDLLTSAGISAGIDMSLRVVTRLHGESIARATARHMEYPYPEDNRRRV